MRLRIDIDTYIKQKQFPIKNHIHYSTQFHIKYLEDFK